MPLTTRWVAAGWGVFWGWRGVGLDSVPCLRGSRVAGPSSLPSVAVSFGFVSLFIMELFVDVASWARNQATGSGNATEENEDWRRKLLELRMCAVATDLVFQRSTNGPPSANQWQCGLQCSLQC